jgi:DnaK suppressor protein
MNKFRKKLENQKQVLGKRLDNGPQVNINQQRRSRFFRRNNDKKRQALLKARADQQMKAVVEAIERIDQGVFGRCVECGQQIEANRLAAIPTTTRCWHCQQENPES